MLSICSASYVKAGFHSGLEAKIYKQQNKHYNFLCAIYNVDTVISELEFHNSEVESNCLALVITRSIRKIFITNIVMNERFTVIYNFLIIFVFN